MTAVVHSFASVLQYVRRVISGESQRSSRKSPKNSRKSLNNESSRDRSQHCCAGDVQSESKRTSYESEEEEEYEEDSGSVFEETDEYYERCSEESSSSLSSTDTMFGISSLPYTHSEESVECYLQTRKRQRKEFLKRRCLKDPKFRERCLRVRVVRRLQIRPVSLMYAAAIQKKAIYNNRYPGEDMSAYESWTWSE